MVMVLKRRIKRVLKKNKAQYIGSVLLVILGSITFMVLNTMSVNLSENLKKFTKISKLEDVKIVVGKPIDNIKELERKYNITVEERRTTDYEIKKGVVLRLFEKTEKINIPAIIQGSNIKNNNEIIVNPAFAKAQKIKIGDNIKVFDKNLKVVGFMSIPDYIYPTKLDADLIADPNTFGIGVVTDEFLQNEKELKSYYSIKYNSENPSGLKNYISDNYGLLMWQDVKDNTRYTMVKGEITSLNSITTIIPVAVFILTCLLLATVMWRMVKMEYIQIGTLYAFGYRKREILFHYLSYPFIIALVGSILGTIISIFAEKPFLDFYVYYYNLPIIEFNRGEKYMAASILLPIVIMVLGIFAVIWRALKLSPLKLMRGYNQNKKAGWLERRLKLNKMRFASKFKIREITRSIPRMLILIFGVTAASMLLLLGFTVQNTFNYLIGEAYKDTYKYNYNYVYSAPQFTNKCDGDIYNAAPVKSAGSDEDFVIYGLKGSNRMIDLKDENGNLLGYNSTIITRSLADSLGVKEGDTVKLTCKLNDKDYDIKVDSIAKVYTGNYIYMPLDKFNKMLGYDKDSFIGLYSSSKQSIDKKLLLKTESRDETITAMESFLKPIRYMMLFIGILAFIIALIVLYIIIALIIEENKTNISMLKVLGYNIKEIKNLLLNSGNIPVVAGYVFSIPLLYFSLGAVMKASLKEVDMAMPVKISLLSIAAGFVIIYMTYELTKLISRKKVMSVSMSEVLKAQRE